MKTKTIFGLLLLSLTEIVTVNTINSLHKGEGTLQSLMIAHGYADLSIFQSRILMPFTVLALSNLAHISFALAHLIVTDIFVALSVVVIYCCVRKNPWPYLIGNFVMFLAFQDQFHLCDWDIVDLTTMFLFAYGVFTNASTRFLFIVFLIELFNRESALYISVWICVSAFIGKRDVRQFSIGALMSVGGFLCIHWLRSTLLRYDAPSGAPGIHTVAGQSIQLATNLHVLLTPMTANHIVPVIAICGILYCCVKFYLSVPSVRSAAIIGLVLVMLGSIIAIGLVAETRVWFQFIPFVLFMLLYRPATATTSRSAQELRHTPNAQ